MTDAGRAELLLEAWRDDPVLAWHDWIPENERPREWQVPALDDLRTPTNRRIAVVTAREGGKSRWQAMAGLHHLVTRPGSLVLAIAPIQRQARSAVWTEVKILWERSPVLRGLFPDWRVQEQEIVTGVAGWRMASLATDDPAGLEGWHSPDTLILIDEAQALPDAHWSSLQGVNPSRLIACGTGGDDAGWFAEAFGHMGWLWNVKRRVTVLEMPRLHDSYRREKKRLGEGSPVLRRMWLAEFCSASEYSMFDEELLRRARGHNPDAIAFKHPFDPGPIVPVVLGVDPARGGPNGDDCACALMIGRRVETVYTLPPGNEMQLAEAIVVEGARWGASTIAIESGGLGHGVFARVRDLIRGRAMVLDYNGSTKAFFAEEAANLKAEIVLALRRMLVEGTIGLPAGEEFDRLAAELMGLRLVTTKEGRVRIQDPPRSPDFADAVLTALSALVDRPSVMTEKVDWL